jgi:AcrR family transcriptional regulator
LEEQMSAQETASTDTKTHILKKAEQLFAQCGYDGVSMREIAEACDITKANIYYYFKDKDSLYMQVLEHDMLEMVATVQRAAGLPGTCREKITRISAAFVRLMRDKRPLIQMSMRHFDGHEHDIRGLVNRYRLQLIQPIEQVLAAGMRSGELRVHHTRLTAGSFMGLLFVCLKLYLLDKGPRISEDDIVQHTVELLFEGIRAR